MKELKTLHNPALHPRRPRARGELIVRLGVNND